MEQRDQELLTRQLRAIDRPAGPPGLIALAILGIFLVGLIAGSMLTNAGVPRIGANGSAIAFLDSGAPITRN